jgi:NDP-sugar pyrophosphorylase family protein
MPWKTPPLGTGGGLKFAARSLPYRSQFLVLNSDVITRFSMNALTEHHHHQCSAITLALVPYRSNWGVVDLDDGDLVCGFRQTPILPYWVSAGVCVCEPEIIDLLPDRGDHDSIFQHVAESGRMFGYRINGYWRGIDTIKDLQAATVEVRNNGYSLPKCSVPKK